VLDVIVMGAGMAGVTAARELAKMGMSVRVIEARDRVGGRIHSIRDFGPAPIEAGAEFIHGLAAETWPDIRAARLAVRPCPYTRDTLFEIGHGAHWLPRTLLHPAVWPTFTILRAIRRLGPHDLSAAEFIAQRGYRGRARILAELTLTAHLPGSLDEVGMLGLLEDHVLDLESGLNHRVVDGYDRLPRHIGVGLDVEFGFVVDQVAWRADGVTVRATDGREVSAHVAITTLPVGVLRAGSVRFTPELPEGKRRALEALEMGPVLKILLRFEERFWPRRLATVVSGCGPIRPLYWAPFYGADDDHDQPILIAYCTGPRAAALGRTTEDESAHVAVSDLRRIFPKANPKLSAWCRIDWASDPFSLGGYTFLRPGGTGARARLAEADTGALFWAGSAAATTTIAASVQGAFVSGLQAAARVRMRLEGSGCGKT
jgi:monoamine oxidase